MHACVLKVVCMYAACTVASALYLTYDVEEPLKEIDNYPPRMKISPGLQTMLKGLSGYNSFDKRTDPGYLVPGFNKTEEILIDDPLKVLAITFLGARGKKNNNNNTNNGSNDIPVYANSFPAGRG